MIYSDNAINILTVKTYKGIGRAWIVKNLKGNETVDTIVSLLNRSIKGDNQITSESFKKNRKNILNDIWKLEEAIDGVVAIGDKNFPPYRGKVKNSDQPVFLFYRGDLSLLEAANKNIAVIGLLNPDDSTEIVEQVVVDEFVKNGATIISGLALGCDSIAHKQALKSKGKTVAILPCDLKNILPATNKELANRIVENEGLLITEYYKDVKSKRELVSRYQERNRLQALFSNCVVLSASYAKNNQGNDSGSRLAMQYALNYSIPRAVIYEPIINKNNSKYDLNRQLIKEQQEITIINRDNLTSSVRKIISNKPTIKTNQISQRNLFD